MKKIIAVAGLTALLVLSSCGTYGNMTSNQNQNQTSVVLSEANYKYVGNVSGEVSQIYVLGFGGLRRSALRNNAVDQMMKEASQNNPELMTGSKAVINVSVHESVKMITPLFVKRTITAHGTVIEFIK